MQLSPHAPGLRTLGRDDKFSFSVKLPAPIADADLWEEEDAGREEEEAEAEDKGESEGSVQGERRSQGRHPWRLERLSGGGPGLAELQGLLRSGYQQLDADEQHGLSNADVTPDSIVPDANASVGDGEIVMTGKRMYVHRGAHCQSVRSDIH